MKSISMENKAIIVYIYMLFDYFVVGDKMHVNNDKLDTKVMLKY